MKGTQMAASELLAPLRFSETLFEKMKGIHAGIEDMALYEFRYCPNNLVPAQGGWAGVELDARDAIEQQDGGVA